MTPGRVDRESSGPVRGPNGPLGADFIVAPSGPLTLQEARVLAHQVTVSIPIR